MIVVGCKLDVRDEEYDLRALMQKSPEIETCMECSALNIVKTQEVFAAAIKAILHPTAPLFDREAKTLKPRCMRALKRIFFLFDVDKDGALNDTELNEFQVKCFGATLKHAERVGVKSLIQAKFSKGVNEFGVTLEGFRFLHSLFIEEGPIERTWCVLSKFGYNNELKLRDYLSTSIKKYPNQSVELTNEAIKFLKGVFNKFDDDKDGVLRDNELEDLFSTAPEGPWNEAPYDDVVKRTLLRGFSFWISINGGNVEQVVRITRRRSVDNKKQQTERNVFQCFVFGPKGAGKSALLTLLQERDFSETYIPTISEKYAVNVVHQHEGNEKILVLREIPKDGVEKLLSNKESLAACDVAIFVYDRQGEESGFAMPCLLIAAKSDLASSSTTNSDSVSVKICADMGINAPICVSVKERQMNDVFSRIVRAAKHPHLSVPETDLGRSEKRRRLFKHAVMCLFGAVQFVGVAAACLADSSKCEPQNHNHSTGFKMPRLEDPWDLEEYFKACPF